ncbi:MAG TPA: host attachment protein [Dongiaceae bacterium]|nr:host attachment protein [Dongiaceae bacterium]
MTKTWILVADAHHAEIWLRQDHQQPEKADVLAPTTQHRFAREIGSDKPGRAIASSDGRHASVEPHADLLEGEHKQFARELTEFLERSLTEHGFDRLVVIAAPKMLGLLRACRTQKLSPLVIAEAAKDLVKSPAEDVRAEILALLS